MFLSRSSMVEKKVEKKGLTLTLRYTLYSSCPRKKSSPGFRHEDGDSPWFARCVWSSSLKIRRMA